MNFQYDVAIVGGGPVGSTLAYQLSSKGLSVCIIEKKKEVGYPLQCAGIVSSHINQLNEIPKNLILNKIKGAFLHSPNHILKVEKEEDVAYVMDRVGYDQYLFNKAIKNNVKLINQKAVSFDLERGEVFLNNDEKISSKIIVGSDGYYSQVSKAMGNNNDFFKASQYLVKFNNDDIREFRKSDIEIDEYVDTCAFSKVFPGFIWIIPSQDNLYRVGLFSNLDYKEQKETLNEFLKTNFNEYEVIERYSGAIPIFDENNILVKNRGLLIGDAACQIKPTSGGGLLLGFDACRIASEYIEKAIKKDDVSILGKYSKNFYEKYLKEFNYQLKVQKTLTILSDDDLDYLFNKLKENNCEEIISKYGDMDKQSLLIKEFIKRGLIFKIIPSFFFKKVSKIFNF